MKERPLRCAAWKARAIRERRATVTRRRIKLGEVNDHPDDGRPWPVGARGKPLACPYGKIGSQLWIMEPWLPARMAVQHGRPYLLASHVPEDETREWNAAHLMPRGACEIIVKITDIKVDHILNVTEADAKAEGFESRLQFFQWWENTYGETDLELNAFVWVITFQTLTPAWPTQT